MSLYVKPLLISRLTPFDSMPIIWSAYALKETDERLFPLSKHRSRRIHKKLVKRFGGEFRKVPAIFSTPQGLLAHPALRADLEARFVQKRRDDYESGVFGRFA